MDIFDPEVHCSQIECEKEEGNRILDGNDVGATLAHAREVVGVDDGSGDNFEGKGIAAEGEES